MASTARMILLVEPDEKARWTDEAKKAGISTAEYIRRAAAVYDPELSPADIEMFRTLTAEASASLARSTAMLDDMIASLKDLNDPAREAEVRARVMAELEANPPRLDFSVFATQPAVAA